MTRTILIAASVGLMGFVPTSAHAQSDAGAPDAASVDAGAADRPAPTPALPPSPIVPPAPPPEAQIEEITVVGTRQAETGGSAHVLGTEKLGRIKRDNPQAILQSVPGVYGRGEDGYGLRPNIGIRGVAPDRSKKLTLMEDGVLFGPAPYSAPAAYYFPLPARIEGVRVVKGPAAISYGPQTVGGAIDLMTRDVPLRPTAGYDLASGQDLYTRLAGHAGGSQGAWGGGFEGALVRTDGFKRLDGGGDTGFRRSEGLGKVRFAPGDGHALELRLGVSEELSHETYLGLTDADFAANPWRRYRASSQDKMTNWRTQARLGHELKQGAFVLRTTAYRHDFHRVWRKVNGVRGADIAAVLANPETPRNQLYYGLITGAVDSSSDQEAILIGPNDRRFVSQGVQSTLSSKALTGPLAHRFEAGVRLHNDSIRRRHEQDGFLVQSGALVPDGRATQVTTNNVAATWALAAFVTDAVTWGPLTLTPGLRTEWIASRLDDHLATRESDNAYVVFLPGLAAYVALPAGLGALAGVHRGFSPRAPGEPDAVPLEKTWNYEAGLRLVRRKVRVEAIGFVNDYGNLTSVCTFSSGCLDMNVDAQYPAGRALIWGGELFADVTFRPAASVTVPLLFAYTHTRTRLRDAFSSEDPTLGVVEAGDELPYVPRHQAAATAGVTFGRADLFGGVTFVDRMREIAGQGALVPGETTDRQLLVDASVGYRLLPTLRLYASATNLLDDETVVSRRPFGARPNAPRRLLAGVGGTF